MRLFEHIQFSKKNFLMLFLGIIALALVPVFVKAPFPLHVIIMILTWSIVGMGWNFIGGYAGQVSIGHCVFYGLGAYTSAICFMYYNITPWVGMWIGVAVSLVVALLIGSPLLRLKGHYFAVATMAVGESVRIVFINTKYVGGATGLDFLRPRVPFWQSMQFPSKAYYFYVLLAFMVAVLLLVIYLDRSKFGYYLRTIKGNEMAAESVGINTSKYKLIAYMLSAAIVSLGGSLYAQYMLYVDPIMIMTLKISLMICLITVMGGVGTIFGPIIGATVLTLISEYSRVFFGGTGTGADLLIYGTLVIIVVIYLPNGIISLYYKYKERQNKEKEVPVHE